MAIALSAVIILGLHYSQSDIAKPSGSSETIPPSSIDTIEKPSSIVSDKSQMNSMNLHQIINASNPSISVNQKTGIIYTSYIKTESELTNVYLVISDDNGKTFSDPVRVNDIVGSAAEMYNLIPIRFGPNNEVYVAWMTLRDDPDFPWGVTEIRVSKSVDGGKTFGPAVNPVMGDDSEKAFFDLAVSDDGTLFVSYLDSMTNQYGKGDLGKIIGYPSSYRLVKSVNGGKSFNSPITLDNQNCVCCQTASITGPNNEVYFAWRDLQYEQDVIQASNDNKYNYGYSNGTIFDDSNYSTGGYFETIRDIVIMHTDDNSNGEKFSLPVKVSQDNWYTASCPDAGPGMAFDSKGRLHVTWFTGSGTARDGLGYYYAYSDDMGQTFSDSIPLLTDKEFIPPTMVSISVDSIDNVWIAFADQRNPEIIRYSGMNDDNPGKIHLSIIDKNQNLIYNDSIISGAIHEFVDMSTYGDVSFISWKDGHDAKLATFKLS